MKKLLMVLLLGSVTMVSFGQTYKFDRVFMNGTFVKMSGMVTITDSSIYFVQNGVGSNIHTTTISKSMVEGKLTQQLISKTEMMDIRFSFVSNSTPTKNENYLLVAEYKDKFNNSVQSIMYFLKD